MAQVSGKHLPLQLRVREAGIAWEDGMELGCPFQRYVEDYPVGFWISRKPCPPCEEMVCGHPNCHAFGKPFRDDNGRFAVVEGDTTGGEE